MAGFAQRRLRASALALAAVVVISGSIVYYYVTKV